MAEKKSHQILINRSSFGVRFGALILDALIIFVLYLILRQAVKSLGIGWNFFSTLIPDSGLITFSVVLFFVITILYFLLEIILGSSPAKLLIGIKIGDVNGNPLSRKKLIYRYLLKISGSLFIIIAFLFIPFYASKIDTSNYVIVSQFLTTDTQVIENLSKEAGVEISNVESMDKVLSAVVGYFYEGNYEALTAIGVPPEKQDGLIESLLAMQMELEPIMLGIGIDFMKFNNPDFAEQKATLLKGLYHVDFYYNMFYVLTLLGLFIYLVFLAGYFIILRDSKIALHDMAVQTAIYKSEFVTGKRATHNEVIEKTVIPLVIMALVLAIVWVLGHLVFVQNFEDFLLDARFGVRGPTKHNPGGPWITDIKVNSDLMIVSVDEESQADDKLGVFPWPRNVYADFLKYFYMTEDEMERISQELANKVSAFQEEAGKFADQPDSYEFMYASAELAVAEDNLNAFNSVINWTEGKFHPDGIFFDLFFDLNRNSDIFKNNQEILPSVYSYFKQYFHQSAKQQFEEEIQFLKEELEEAKNEVKDLLKKVKPQTARAGGAAGGGYDSLYIAQASNGNPEDSPITAEASAEAMVTNTDESESVSDVSDLEEPILQEESAMVEDNNEPAAQDAEISLNLSANPDDWKMLSEKQRKEFENLLHEKIKLLGDEEFIQELAEVKAQGLKVYVDYYTLYSGKGVLSGEEVKARWEYMKDYVIDDIIVVEEDMMSSVPVITPPMTDVLKNLAGTGAAAVEQESDGKIRRMGMVFRFNGQDQSLAYQENLLYKDKPITAKSPVYLTTIDTAIFLFQLGIKPGHYNEMVKLKDGRELPRISIKTGEAMYIRNAVFPIKEPVITESNFRKHDYWKVIGYKTVDEIVIPLDNEGKFIINFQGKHESFDVANIYEFFPHLAPDLLPPNYLGWNKYYNRILMMGFYSSAGLGTGKDYFETPYGTMYGIEIHANALFTLFSMDFITKLEEWQNFLIQLALALLLTFAIPRLSIIRGTIIFFLFIMIFFMGNIFWWYASNHLIDINMMGGLMAISLTFLAMIVYKVLYEEKEKRQIKGMFSNYVNAEVVDELMQNPEKLQLGGETKDITVLFSDIRGFTTLSEGLTPQELVEHLNIYLSAMTDTVFDYKGTLDKYVGDEIMAFWGAPVENPNHALFACRAAITMMIRLEEMNKNWPDSKKLRIGIGLNTGQMVVGNMGSEVRKDYTLMGDNVNLGARLEGVNKMYKTNIIISEFTYGIVKDHVIVRELDLIRVKGKHKPVCIYELVGMKEGPESVYINQFSG